MLTELQATQSARIQYRAVFKSMAVSGMRWNFHKGSANVVLLREDATLDVPLPIILSDVQAMSEETMINKLCAALRNGV